jgi:hypothetical protein
MDKKSKWKRYPPVRFLPSDLVSVIAVSNFSFFEVSYVLPHGYAYGFRGPKDSIWGLWKPINGSSDFSFNQSVIVCSLLQKYGNKLDIVYDESLQPRCQ